jgi:hypothetical protein
MNLTAFIRDIIGSTRNIDSTVDSKTGIESEPVLAGNDTDELAAILNSMDGMGTGTARFIIDRKLPENIGELYHIEGLENKGRYYLAKIIGEGGRVVNQLLVNKQNGTIHFLKTPMTARRKFIKK